MHRLNMEAKKPIISVLINEGVNSDLKSLVENFGLSICLWMIGSSESSLGSHRLAYLLPE